MNKADIYPVRKEEGLRTMRKEETESFRKIVFTKDNPGNIRSVIECCKNIVVCGVKGVGKITNTIQAVKDNTNVYYIGNPVDFEGKKRPGSYERYLNYIMSLKKDLNMVKGIQTLFKMKQKIILIIDEIYGRSDAQLEQIDKLFDMENIQVIQIVGCMKNMGNLIDKIDIIIDMHHSGAFIVDKELAKAICRIFGPKPHAGR
jgi:hypothetical protein